MKKVLDVIVESNKNGCSCFISSEDKDIKFNVIGAGKTAKAAIEDFYLGVEEMKQVDSEVGNCEFRFILDVGAYFSYYPLSISAFAKYIGMNASLLRQYAAGVKSPSPKTLAKIRNGFDKVSADIRNGYLINKPVISYV